MEIIFIVVVVVMVFCLVMIGENKFQKEQDKLYKKCLENLLKNLK